MTMEIDTTESSLAAMPGSGLSVCTDCPDAKQCKAIGECVTNIMVEAMQIEDDYIAAGVCSDCGACSLTDANNKCRPKQCQSGEWSCAGEKLWRDADDSEDCPNDLAHGTAGGGNQPQTH